MSWNFCPADDRRDNYWFLSKHSFFTSHMEHLKAQGLGRMVEFFPFALGFMPQSQYSNILTAVSAGMSEANLG